MRSCCSTSRARPIAPAILLLFFVGCQTSNVSKWPERLNPLTKKPKQDQTPGLQLDSTISNPNATQKADVAMAVARSLELKGRDDQAIKVYLDVAKKDKKRADVYHRLAVLHDQKEDTQKAEQFYREAIKRAPNNPLVHGDLGYSHYLRKRWKLAEEHLRKATELDPTMATAHNNLGLLLARTGRIEEAFSEFTKAGCTRTDAHANVAFALILEERWPQAKHHLQLASARDPISQSKRDELERIQALIPHANTPAMAVASQRRSNVARQASRVVPQRLPTAQ